MSKANVTESQRGNSDKNALLCATCEGCGIVCEEHTYLPWQGVSNSHRVCDCGGAGVLCPECKNQE